MAQGRVRAGLSTADHKRIAEEG